MTERPECLRTSVTLRMPVFRANTPIREKVDALESYMLLSAFTQGDLAEERLRVHDELAELRAEWRAVTPTPGARLRTKDEREEAKRVVAPDLTARIEALEEMIERLNEEFNRLEADATKASRAHTFITGR